MKTSIIPFPLSLYQSNGDGTAAVFRMSTDLRKTIGQAKALRYQFIGFKRSANARINLVIHESPYEGMAADEIMPGNAPFHASANLDTLRAAPVTVSGPFGTNVELVLKCSASAGGGLEDWYGLVAVTLIVEE